MAFMLFNTLTRQKEVLDTRDENVVSMYCCGPTVYNYAHIGNLRAFLTQDFLRRALEYNGFKVKHVMNITDVGHLTDDGDDGEDKMEKGAAREGKTVWEVAKHYTQAFLSDLKALSIKEPGQLPKATDHIEDMIAMIKTLEEKGHTYIAGGNVYFDISSFPYYSDLGRLNLEQMRQTSRAIEGSDDEKRNPQDFVLWFTQSKFENHAMQWDSPWGRGYPGWHIECSAMSTKYLGDQFDIHCGGCDHIQVHHTNEIAQTECATEKHPWVRYWVHNEFLVLNDAKMAKSGENFITLQTLTDKGYNPVVYRYFCMGASYRQQLKFTWEALDNAKSGYTSLMKKVVSLKQELPDHEDPSKLVATDEKSEAMLSFEKKFTESLNDDVNITKALALVHEVLKSELDAAQKYVLLLDFDSVLGLGFGSVKVPAATSMDSNEDMSAVNELLAKREEARVNRDWELADTLRDQIIEYGFDVNDTPEGPKLTKKDT